MFSTARCVRASVFSRRVFPISTMPTVTPSALHSAKVKGNSSGARTAGERTTILPSRRIAARSPAAAKRIRRSRGSDHEHPVPPAPASMTWSSVIGCNGCGPAAIAGPDAAIIIDAQVRRRRRTASKPARVSHRPAASTERSACTSRPPIDAAGIESDGFFMSSSITGGVLRGGLDRVPCLVRRLSARAAGRGFGLLQLGPPGVEGIRSLRQPDR
jgi:hypothetical protein